MRNVQVHNCTYLIGGYMTSVDSGQPGATDEELYDQVMASFRLASETFQRWYTIHMPITTLFIPRRA